MPRALPYEVNHPGSDEHSHDTAIAYVTASREGHRECIARQCKQHCPQCDPDGARPQQDPGHYERYCHYEVGMYVPSARMQFRECALHAIFATEIRHAGKYGALENRHSDYGNDSRQHAASQSLEQALRLPGFLYQEGQQKQRPREALQLPETVITPVIAHERVVVDRREREKTYH